MLDVNVVVSGLLTPSGVSAQLLRCWRQGAFEVVTSPLLLGELGRVLAYPKFHARLSADERAGLVKLLASEANLVDDPPSGSSLAPPDPDDDYLLALAIARSAYLVTGDRHLLGIDPMLPIETPDDFLRRVDPSPS